MRAATYTAGVLAALAGVAAVDALLLPVTTAWAGDHGLWGWTLWLAWAAAALAAIHGTALTRRRSTISVWTLHAVAVAAVFMAIAAPVRWTGTLTAVAGTAAAWLIVIAATRWRPRT
jgi:hypothetical protein